MRVPVAPGSTQKTLVRAGQLQSQSQSCANLTADHCCTTRLPNAAEGTLVYLCNRLRNSASIAVIPRANSSRSSPPVRRESGVETSFLQSGGGSP